MLPSIFIVPGFYEGPRVFDPLVAVLRTAGFESIHTATIKSTGTIPPGNPTMDDDIAALAIELASLVEEAGDRGVVAIFHSAGGFLGSAAMKGLSVEARKLSGKAGGVRAIVFLAAGVLLEGAEQESWPFMEVNVSNGTQTCRNPMDLLFHDFPSMETHKWLELIQHQPVNWGTTLNYCGWREVPSTYIICEADRLLPMELQEQMASLASSRKVRLPNAGHMAQLSHVHEVAVAVREACQ